MMILVAKWLCPCGNTIRSSGSIPNPQEWSIVSAADLSYVASAAQLTNDEAIVEFYNRTRFVYRCDSCGRLHVYWDKEQSWPPSVYAPEPDAYS